MSGKPLLVVLTGAGISAESGLATFRGSGGLWEGFDVNEVASIDGWRQNPQKVIEFYNLRRRQALAARPNEGHIALAALESRFDVQVITQNVDVLHEEAGSTRVLHLHGRLDQIRSEAPPFTPVECRTDQPLDAWLPVNGRMRPHIVWFGEEVPLMQEAMAWVQRADFFLVVGTSLQVYPAAGLLQFRKPGTPSVYVDPDPDMSRLPVDFQVIRATASAGLKEWHF